MSKIPDGPATAESGLGITNSLAERLRSAGLDPVAVAGFVTAALAEDLAGGSDVTPAATVGTGGAGPGGAGDQVCRGGCRARSGSGRLRARAGQSRRCRTGLGRA